ncbi:DUF4123 domain-containing protein [Pseudomonas xanthosomatis]|uniref:DUF4123 domain-containing protein n=1 Tax=Pseudomonas xanthosomatis TaxID=2842356 RepID=UPI001C3CDA5A|nr:DUF4123 domain-containing protein [Pseudomonas xanthosomatis]QXH44767.1 DUF4123 domain-containing protein [Pseudomonas xanthosomatis]
MPSEPLSPMDWLQQQPLAEGEYLYAVMGSASDAEPMANYYRKASPEAPIPLWGGTPYAGWRELMPYLDRLPADSPMLDWVAATDACDWGWLAVSRAQPAEVAEHLRGLTQVLMPDGTGVFFRFWDGQHLLPILDWLGERSGELLPVFIRYWVNGQPRDGHALPHQGPQPYPWWEVPQALLDHLTQQDPSTLIDNLLQTLREDHADLYFAQPEANLRLKVAQFVRYHAEPMDSLGERVVDHLIQEVAP